jgi:large subunit ribosomal protein L18
MKSSVVKYKKRQLRIRSRLKRFASNSGRLRFSVHRTNQHIYAQIIDDIKAQTLVAASTNESGIKSKLKSTSGISAAEEIGKEFARRAKKAGVTEVFFDRGAFPYHGRIAALANGARSEGLKF